MHAFTWTAETADHTVYTDQHGCLLRELRFPGQAPWCVLQLRTRADAYRFPGTVADLVTHDAPVWWACPCPTP